MSTDRQPLPLYISAAHECSYLPDRESRSLFVDPDAPMNMARYSRLIERGFRRSGGLVYRPQCDNCKQCLSVRIPVNRFAMRRRFRRLLRRNSDLHMEARDSGFVQAHYELYCRYMAARHADGSMANPTPEDYAGFLMTDWSDTRFLELRRHDRLMAVAVTDVVEDGLSAVYTFFDPDEARRSLGTHAVLSQLELHRALRLPYLYLGYWVRDCDKMRYKADFRPLQVFSENQWREFGVHEAIRVPELHSS